MPIFSIWLTNPRTVVERDPYFDPYCGSLPNELPIVPVVRGRNRAERVVAMLRQRDGQATFRISEFPPDQYKTERTNICFLSEEVEQGRFGKGIQALLRLADEICILAQGDDADLVVFHNDLPAGQIGDADKKEPEFRIDEKAKPDEMSLGGTKPPKKGSGRPADTDSVRDAKLYDAWKKCGAPTYAEGVNLLSSRFGDLTEAELRAAVDRHRKRLRGSE